MLDVLSILFWIVCLGSPSFVFVNIWRSATNYRLLVVGGHIIITYTLCIITLLLLFCVEYLIDSYNQGCVERYLAAINPCNNILLNFLDIFKEWYLIIWLMIAPIGYALLMRNVLIKCQSKGPKLD